MAHRIPTVFEEGGRGDSVQETVDLEGGRQLGVEQEVIDDSYRVYTALRLVVGGRVRSAQDRLEATLQKLHGDVLITMRGTRLEKDWHTVIDNN